MVRSSLAKKSIRPDWKPLAKPAAPVLGPEAGRQPGAVDNSQSQEPDLEPARIFLMAYGVCKLLNMNRFFNFLGVLAYLGTQTA